MWNKWPNNICSYLLVSWMSWEYTTGTTHQTMVRMNELDFGERSADVKDSTSLLLFRFLSLKTPKSYLSLGVTPQAYSISTWFKKNNDSIIIYLEISTVSFIFKHVGHNWQSVPQIQITCNSRVTPLLCAQSLSANGYPTPNTISP